MKKRFILLIILIIISLIIPTISANNNLYNKENLELELKVEGNFELKAKSDQAKVSEVTAELLLFPKSDYRQEVLELDSLGEEQGNQINFNWQDKKIEKKKFGYLTYIKTENQRKKVKEKLTFPISSKKIKDHTKFLQPTKSIDSNNQEIISKAAELAEGEDDLFKVVFKLANWVEENVDYELDSITAKASMKSSWVLENRRGVCDEMTSLFISMARSLGIPARFVSGISYTTSELFDKPWQPHGWAEVYFPDIGWVSFDTTFGEYGYIDATHIKLRDGFDPTDPATKFEWIAEDVDLKTSPINFQVEIRKEGKDNEKEILLKQELLGKEVGFGSYNLVKGILENTKDYYVATTLRLSIPKEVTIQGKDKRTILLSPKEKKETYWVIKLSNDLKKGYSYQFPTMIYSENNFTTMSSFSAQVEKRIYSKQEVEELIVEEDDKTYSNLVNINCNYEDQIKLNTKLNIECQIKNQGNSNLKNIEFCIEKECETIDLQVNQKKERKISIKQKEVGWKMILISAKNELIEKKQLIQFSVLDQPLIKLEVEAPYSIDYGEKFEIIIRLDKNSFSKPQDVSIILTGPGFTNEWEIDQLNQKTELPLELDKFPLAKNNRFSIMVNWEDESNGKFSKEKKVLIEGKSNNFQDKIKLSLNSLINLFR